MSRQTKPFWASTTAMLLVLSISTSDVSAETPPKDFIVPELKGSPEELQKLKEIMPPRPVVKDQVDLPRYPDPRAKNAQGSAGPDKKKRKAAQSQKTKKARTTRIEGGERITYQKPKPTRMLNVGRSRATSHPVYVFERGAKKSVAKPSNVTARTHGYAYRSQILHPKLTHAPHAHTERVTTRICYEKVHTPAQYKTVTKRVLVRPEKLRKHIIPARYREIERRVLVRPEKVKVRHHKARYGYVREKVLVKPERVHVRSHPARVRHVNERVLVSPPGQRVHVTPPQYGYVNRRVQVAPARNYWTVHARKGQCGIHPVYCRVQTPPQYVDQAQRVLVRPGQRYVENIPARYQTITRQVIERPAYNEKIVSPAVYRSIKKKVVLSPAWEERLVKPAKYKIVRERVLVHPEKTKIYREPAVYKTITKNVLVSREQTRFQRVHVKKGGC